MSYTVQAARDAVRALVRDGQPSYASGPFGLVRQERLDDQIPAVATPTLKTFYVRYTSVPLGKNVTVQAVPVTIAAYRDGLTVPDTVSNGRVTADIDQNGTFTLQAAPVSQLLVTYGWQFFSDGDIDQHVAGALSWLFQWSDIGQIPNAINSALAQYAAALACQAIGRQCRLGILRAGEASEDLAKIAAGYEQDAKDFQARAEKARADYWTSADQPKSPAGAVQGLQYPPFQPIR